jgi:hypothetical protein
VLNKLEEYSLLTLVVTFQLGGWHCILRLCPKAVIRACGACAGLLLQLMYTDDKDATAARAAIGATLGLVHVAYIIFFLSQFLPQLLGYAGKLFGTLYANPCHPRPLYPPNIAFVAHPPPSPSPLRPIIVLPPSWNLNALHGTDGTIR